MARRLRRPAPRLAAHPGSGSRDHRKRLGLRWLRIAGCS